ncbi:hypothetical protein Hhel01_03035 [Haloferula helveola]
MQFPLVGEPEEMLMPDVIRVVCTALEIDPADFGLNLG